MHQYAPTNIKSQRGLNSNDYNIPDEAGIKIKAYFHDVDTINGRCCQLWAIIFEYAFFSSIERQENFQLIYLLCIFSLFIDI